METVKYDYDYLNELCDRVDLLSYAEKTCTFERRGGKYFCCCPKHSDSDPSLCISPDKNLFYCFSCGRKGNLINWLMEFEGLKFHEAVKKLGELTGEDIESYVVPESMKFYDSLNKLINRKTETDIVRPELDIEKDYRQKFKAEFPQEWIDEGITEDEIRKYEIRIDPMSNRIVYPVYTDDGKLISVKGRTRFKNYKELKIVKYINYYSLGGRLDYFQGMQQARQSIQDSGEIIIVEGLKSVMKIDGWGFHNTVSAETSKLNEHQIELLLRMKIKDVVIAFDEDVKLQKIRECTNLLKRFANVFAVYDKWGVLDKKDSPCDKGRDVWERLYNNRIRIS